MKCILWKSDHIEIIDQTKLPSQMEFIRCYDVETLGQAIKNLSIRGAPALGIAAAMGIALASVNSKTDNPDALRKELWQTRQYIASTRPTAVNLFWALDRVMNIAMNSPDDVNKIKEAIINEALKIAAEDERMCRAIGENGAKLIRDNFNILHHCNTGFLATGEHGTALGVIRSAHEEGKKIHVWVDETRPLLQGARLTAWELMKDNIPFTLIADNMAGYVMKQKKVDIVLVGADRITASGDVANKIGTYSVAVLAKYHGIPFYSAAPFSTIDLTIKSGKDIIIEERNPNELIYFMGVQSAPEGSHVYNPSFDVTPNELITGIITERGIIYPPFEENLKRMKESPWPECR
jgi:methylthioribose-1-phosphate isomerase